MGRIKINGKTFPAPDEGLELFNVTFVKHGRNANMKVVAQPIGRTQYKIDGLTWHKLPSETWAEICQECEKFRLEIEFPDMVTNSLKTLTFYPGDRRATPIYATPGDILPVYWKNCKVNAIDIGD